MLYDAILYVVVCVAELYVNRPAPGPPASRRTPRQAGRLAWTAGTVGP